MQIELPGTHRRFALGPGEMVRVEISRKFRLERLRVELPRYRLQPERVFTDPEELFALLLLRRVEARERDAA